MSTTNDKRLLTWYRRGFRDELLREGHRVKRKDIILHNLENVAYKLGALHAIVGDDLRSVDYLSDEEILKLIKK